MSNEKRSGRSVSKVEFVIFIMSCVLAVTGCRSSTTSATTERAEPTKGSSSPLPVSRNGNRKQKSNSDLRSRGNGSKIREKRQRRSTRMRSARSSRRRERSNALQRIEKTMPWLRSSVLPEKSTFCWQETPLRR